MYAYLGRRLLASLVSLLALSLVAFFLVRLVPGDTVSALLGTHYDPADAAALRERLGLDRPIGIQYGRWLGNLLRGELGTTAAGEPVGAAIARALPVTGALVSLALAWAVATGIPLGVFAAVRRGGWVDHAASFLGLLGVSVPAFWLGTMLILLFSLKLGWLPPGRAVPVTEDPAEALRHLILPGVALGSAVGAVLLRTTRSAMAEVLAEPYMQAARARGVGWRSLFFGHGLWNAMIPVLTILGVQVGYLLGGSVVIEQVFSLSGVGRLLLRSVLGRDYALLQALILLIGLCFVLVNLATDLLYAWVDPRLAEPDAARGEGGAR